jgi:hypothetical protein
MEPLRTGLSEGAFCVLGDFGGNARSLDFASDSLCESDAALGMTNLLSDGVRKVRDAKFYLVMESEN